MCSLFIDYSRKVNTFEKKEEKEESESECVYLSEWKCSLRETMRVYYVRKIINALRDVTASIERCSRVNNGMVFSFENIMHPFHFRYLRLNGCNDCVRPRNGWCISYSETLLKFRSKFNAKVGSVPLRVRFQIKEN